MLCYVAQEQSDHELQEEIAKAHVVCVVFDVTVEDSFDRVGFRLSVKFKIK